MKKIVDKLGVDQTAFDKPGSDQSLPCARSTIWQTRSAVVEELYVEYLKVNC